MSYLAESMLKSRVVSSFDLELVKKVDAQRPEEG